MPSLESHGFCQLEVASSLDAGPRRGSSSSLAGVLISKRLADTA